MVPESAMVTPCLPKICLSSRPRPQSLCIQCRTRLPAERNGASAGASAKGKRPEGVVDPDAGIIVLRSGDFTNASSAVVIVGLCVASDPLLGIDLDLRRGQLQVQYICWCSLIFFRYDCIYGAPSPPLLHRNIWPGGLRYLCGIME